MTGKKVFTAAGELLATFLVNQQNSLTNTKNLIDTLNDINSINDASTTNYVNSFQEFKTFSRQELINYFKTELSKELSFIKVTNGEKELTTQEMVQYLYNEFQYIDKLNAAQFDALVELISLNFADLYKKSGSQFRSFSMITSQLRKNFADLSGYTLDHFIGSDPYKDSIFLKTSGNKMMAFDGAGSSGKFYEIFKVSSLTPTSGTGNQAIIGDTLYVGGTETNSPFKKISFTHDLYCQGDINMADGKEFKGTALKSRYADLAEMYTSDKEYQPGTLLQVNTSGDSEVTEYNPTSGNICIGVVSDKPGFVLNEDLEFKDSTKENNKGFTVAVVLTGKSPVKVQGVPIKGELLYTHPELNGITINVRPTLRKEFERSNPLSQYIGVVLETDSEALEKAFECMYSNSNYDNINLCYTKIG